MRPAQKIVSRLLRAKSRPEPASRAGDQSEKPAATRSPSGPRSQFSHGNVKVRLCWLTISCGNRSPRASISNALGRPRSRFCASGSDKHVFDERLIQQRNAHLERVAHAHRVGIAQERIHEVGAQLEPGDGGEIVHRAALRCAASASHRHQAVAFHVSCVLAQRSCATACGVKSERVKK